MANSIEVMQEVIASHHNNPKWTNAPLGDIKTLSNSHVGSVGQAFIREWCKHLGIAWEGQEGGPQGPWDAKLMSITFEIKTATEDVSGNFQFNHIRHHRTYQALLCLGVAPDAVLFDAWRKGDVAEGVAGHLVTMDAGSSATFKLTKKRADLRSIDEFEAHLGVVVAAITGS
ncbi:MAG: hypothetical protein OXR67_02155 [Chloroflexota bacterium]|nr:hypothetical protein [Chloroflexota bacterium]